MSEQPTYAERKLANSRYVHDHMEMQTANEYRHMVIMNDRDIYDKLRDAFATGNIAIFIQEINNYLHKCEVPWDGCQPTTAFTGPPDGNRWLPLMRRLANDFYEINGLDEMPAAANVYHRVRWIWESKWKPILYNTYTKGTGLEFLKDMTKVIAESYESTGKMVDNEDYSLILMSVMDKCQEEMNLARAHDDKLDAQKYEQTLLLDPLDVSIKGNFIFHKLATLTEDNIMTPITLELCTFINGINSNNVSDEQIFGYIADLEAEAKELEKMKTSSTAIDKRVSDLYKSARKLAKFVDKRVASAS